MVLGLLSIFYTFKSFDYAIVFSLTPFFVSFFNLELPFLTLNIDMLVAICFFLFIGAVGKSAQIGLHT
jgi:NADH:ubiquinone oxidoreductase subunit 5 (subunit L)/multisubunit Na+/H+ antiporter MnhA subunit